MIESPIRELALMPAAGGTLAVVRPAERAFSFQHRLPALDGLRGFAILLVFFYHFLLYPSGELPIRSGVLRALTAPARFGWCGVDLFFVLSGFLITGILYDTREHLHYFRNFYLRRVLRIFPAYYLLILVLLALTPLTKAHWQPGHLWFLVYLGNPAVIFQHDLTQISPWVFITHLWSLAVEEQFYLVWPLVIYLARDSKQLIRICLGVIAAAFCIRVIIVSLGLLPPHAVYILLFCRMDALAMGGALAVAVRSGQWSSLSRWLPWLGLLAGLALVIIKVTRNADFYDPAMATAGFSLIAIASAAVLIKAISPGSVLQRIFRQPVLRFFGKYSYGLYVIHFVLLPVLALLRPALARLTKSESLGHFLFVAASLGICVLVAMMSFHWIEQPILRFKDRFSYAGSGVAVCG